MRLLQRAGTEQEETVLKRLTVQPNVESLSLYEKEGRGWG
jgi:hypothetical protein